MDYPPYDLDRLQKVARLRLIEDGVRPTSLAIYHMVARMRTEEVRYAREFGGGSYVLENTALDIPGGCTE